MAVQLNLGPEKSAHDFAAFNRGSRCADSTQISNQLTRKPTSDARMSLSTCKTEGFGANLINERSPQPKDEMLVNLSRTTSAIR